MKTYLILFNRASAQWCCDEANSALYGEVRTQGMLVSVYTRGASRSSAYFLGMCVINKFLNKYGDILPDPPKKFRQLVRYCG